MKIRLAAISFLLGAVGITAGAQVPGGRQGLDAGSGCSGVVEDFQQRSFEITRDLMAKGYDSFDGVSLSALSALRSRVSVEAHGYFERPEATVPMLHTARSTAQWSCDKSSCKIQVNCDLWRRSSTAARKIISFHEHSGPAGLNDHHYQNSTRLWLLSLPEADEILTPEERSVIAKGVRFAGGITAVGGGGDTGGVSPKVALLKMDLMKLKGVAEINRRRAAFENLLLDFDIKNEIRRGPGGSELESYSETTVARADDLNRFNVCNEFLHQSRALQVNAYHALIKRDVKMQQTFPAFSDILVYCRKAVGDLP